MTVLKTAIEGCAKRLVQGAFCAVKLFCQYPSINDYSAEQINASVDSITCITPRKRYLLVNRPALVATAAHQSNLHSFSHNKG